MTSKSGGMGPGFTSVPRSQGAARANQPTSPAVKQAAPAAANENAACDREPEMRERTTSRQCVPATTRASLPSLRQLILSRFEAPAWSEAQERHQDARTR